MRFLFWIGESPLFEEVSSYPFSAGLASYSVYCKGFVFALGFSKKYDLSLLLVVGRVLDRCRAFDRRLASVDAHLPLSCDVKVSSPLLHSREVLVSSLLVGGRKARRPGTSFIQFFLLAIDTLERKKLFVSLPDK
jgi:hypothetical protein